MVSHPTGEFRNSAVKISINNTALYGGIKKLIDEMFTTM